MMTSLFAFRVRLLSVLSVLLLSCICSSAHNEKDGTFSAALTGQITSVSGKFGNLRTNISAASFTGLGYKVGDQVSSKIDGKAYTLPFVRSVIDVSENKPFLGILDNQLMIGVNHGNAQSYFNVKPPVSIEIAKK